MKLLKEIHHNIRYCVFNSVMQRVGDRYYINVVNGLVDRGLRSPHILDRNISYYNVGEASIVETAYKLVSDLEVLYDQAKEL